MSVRCDASREKRAQGASESKRRANPKIDFKWIERERLVDCSIVGLVVVFTGPLAAESSLVQSTLASGNARDSLAKRSRLDSSLPSTN